MSITLISYQIHDEGDSPDRVDDKDSAGDAESGDNHNAPKLQLFIPASA